MPAPKRTRAYRQGLWAETAAACLLRVKGYRVLERRFRSPVGEVDLIVVRRRRLAFVEVKLRAGLDAAAWSVTPHQQGRIVRAADYWLARHPAYQRHDIAFDVILMAPWARPRHMQSAFQV